MMLLRQSRWISTFLVAVIALAWFGASNHCALAALEGSRQVAHACCHESGPDAPKPQSAMQCCNTFHVVVPTLAALPLAALHALPAAWLGTFCLSAVSKPSICAEFRATGPPRAHEFAEIVLNRSLLSHAPPRFVA